MSAGATAEHLARKRRTVTLVCSVVVGLVLAIGLLLPLRPVAPPDDREIVPCGVPLAKLFVDRMQLDPYGDNCDLPLQRRVTVTGALALGFGLFGIFYSRHTRRREIAAELEPHPDDVPDLRSARPWDDTMPRDNDS